MRCNNCGNQLRIGAEQVGMDSKGLPVIHRFGYCDNCQTKWDLDLAPQPQNGNGNVVKYRTQDRESNMSAISMVCGIVGLLLTIIFIGIIPSVVAMILGIVCIIENKPNKKRAFIGIVLSGISFVIFLILCVSFSGSGSAQKNNAVTEKQDYFNEELELYAAGEYKYILPSDLYKYHSNMEGVKFYTVVQVDDIKDGVIQSNIDTGYMMSNFHPVKDYSKTVNEDDTIAVMGEVDDYMDYGSVGKSIDFKNCYIFSTGENAEKYKKKESDASFSQYFKMTDEVAKGSNELSKEEFKSICKELDYEDILRNPDSYKDKHCSVNGNVSQIIEGSFDSYTIYLEDSSGNIWGCTYIYEEGESRVLEGDTITVYGLCDGTETSEMVLGKQVTMPYVKIEYIE